MSTPAVRISLPVQLLLLSTLLTNAGQFMALPFLTIYLVTTLHYAPWQIGSILSADMLCAYALPLIAGMVGDRTSHSATIIIGVAVEGLGFIGLAISQSFAPLLCSAALIGTGTALFTPSVNSIFATQPEAWRTLTFTRFNQALNVGVIAGPLFGSLLIAGGPKLPFLGGGAIFLVIAGALLFAQRHYPTAQTSSSVLRSLKQVFGYRRFLAFGGTSIFFWVIFTQLSVSFPLQAFRVSHQDSAASAVFIVNGMAGLLLMFGLGRFFQKKSAFALARLGVLAAGIGFAIVPLWPSLIWLLGCVFVYTLGETLFLPASDIAVAEMSPRGQSGAFFGAFSLSWAIGGILGSYLGAWLMEQGGSLWPWLTYGGIGLMAFLLMAPLTQRAAPQGVGQERHAIPSTER